MNEFDLNLSRVRLRAQRWGAPDRPLVLCVHGISAHMHAFDFLAPRLATPQRQLVAVDLRGRGRSEITAPGSYGLDAHARDILEIADALGAEHFDLVGWSMGGLIGIGIANRAPSRLRRLAIIDHAGPMDPGALATVERGLARLDIEVPDPETYTGAIATAGTISPWSEFWERYYRYELGPSANGFKPTTSRAACQEDLVKLLAEDWPTSWKGVVIPSLLIRCNAPIGGDIVPPSSRDRFKATASQLDVVEVATNHFTVMTDPQAAQALENFLSPAG